MQTNTYCFQNNIFKTRNIFLEKAKYDETKKIKNGWCEKKHIKLSACLPRSPSAKTNLKIPDWIKMFVCAQVRQIFCEISLQGGRDIVMAV